MNKFSYLRCANLEEVEKNLYGRKDACYIIAGGTDILVQMKNGQVQPEKLIDISKIKELEYIKKDNGFIKIGALITHSVAAGSSLIIQFGKVLAEACSKVGSPQIRNMGTIVGNVINAQPAADAAVALHALDAELEVRNNSSVRWLPVAEAYVGLGKCAIAGQLVTAIRFHPLTDNQGSSFKRIARRESLALPMLNTAVVVTIKDNIFEQVRIFAAPIGPVPMKMADAEQFLLGKQVNEENIEAAGNLVTQKAEPRSSIYRGSSEYRKNIIASLVCEAVKEACSEAIERS